MLRAPTHDELAREAFYVREVFRVDPQSPIGQTFLALDVPDHWSTPALERALQYAFRVCYDPTLWNQVLMCTASATLPAVKHMESHPSEALLASDLEAGVMSARLHKPVPPVVPTALRVPGTQLGVLASRYLIWKTKASRPHTSDPYEATMNFIRALKFEDPTSAIGSRFPRYHVFLAIIVTLVHKALETMPAMRPNTSQILSSLQQMQKITESSHGHEHDQQNARGKLSSSPIMDSESAVSNNGPTVSLRLPGFKILVTVQNTDALLEVRSLLQSKKFPQRTAYFIDQYIPPGLALAARTGEGNLKPFRLGVDKEAWPTPPAEIQPLRFRVGVFVQGKKEPTRLVDRTLVARYSNGMDVWPTVADPYRIHELAKKMQDHVRSVMVFATNGVLDENEHSCAIFTSTSALNSIAKQTDPTLGPISHQIIYDLLHLAKSDVDFEGKCHVKVYVPEHIFGSKLPLPPDTNYISDESPQWSGVKRVRVDLDAQGCDESDQTEEHRVSIATSSDDLSSMLQPQPPSADPHPHHLLPTSSSSFDLPENFEFDEALDI